MTDQVSTLTLWNCSVGAWSRQCCHNQGISPAQWAIHEAGWHEIF